MNKKLFWLSMVAVAFSFAGGFLLANSLNRKELSEVRSENENLKKARSEQAAADEEGGLSDGEIAAKIAEADRNPSNLAYQKNLGLALYRYAAMKRDAKLFGEVARLLTRVVEASPDDYEATVALADINFDLGYANKSNDNFLKARGLYQKALDKKPDDAEVRTDLGLTYYLSKPPQSELAVAEFQKALKVSPKNEKTLQALVEALRSENKTGEAEKYVAALREINPNNEVLIDADSADGSQKQ